MKLSQHQVWSADQVACRQLVILRAQVFVALLRISQPDGRRAVVRQALDVLTPALVKRLPQGENRYPIWIRSVHLQTSEIQHVCVTDAGLNLKSSMGTPARYVRCTIMRNVHKAY